MKKHKGTITKSGNVLAKDIDVWVEIVREKNGMCSWHGALSAPLQSGVSILRQNNENFRLRLDDGREGEFFIASQSMGTHQPNAIQFQGTGPLERTTSN